MSGIENNNKLKSELKKLALCTLGAIVFAFNLNSFVQAGGLYPGGFAGITVLVQDIFGTYFGIELPYTIIYIPLNLIPVVIGLKYLGKSFTLHSLYVIAMSSVMTDILPTVSITYDVLLISIFGGIVNGIAVGLSLCAGASAGGTDFISLFFSQKKGIDTFNYIFMGNVCVLITAGIIFGFDRALYSIIFQFCSTQLIQMLYKRYQRHTFFIITEYPDMIYEKIKATTHHDATLFKGVGCYKGVERPMLYSVISSEEVDKVMSEIMKADPGAFVNVIKTEQLGGWFYNRPHD